MNKEEFRINIIRSNAKLAKVIQDLSKVVKELKEEVKQLKERPPITINYPKEPHQPYIPYIPYPINPYYEPYITWCTNNSISTTGTEILLRELESNTSNTIS